MAKGKRKEEMRAFLGKGADFSGKLLFTGFIRIDGRFRGEIYGEGTLIVGQGAEIQAEISVDRLIVHGDVRGEARIREQLSLGSSGHFIGAVHTPALIMSGGAILEGEVRMPGDREGATAAGARAETTAR